MVKTAIVTGSSRGIGAEAAKKLGQAGFAVIVNYVSNKEAAEGVVDSIRASGGHAVCVKADVSKENEVSRLFDLAREQPGEIAVLVNNAGIMELSPIAQTDDATVTRHLDANFRGVFNTMREAAKRMDEGGRIINVSSSILGLRLPNYGIYAATKAAVESLTVTMANEMRGRRITVNAVAPGPTKTDLFLKGKPQEVIDQLSRAAPLERLGEPKDIADIIAFLAGPEGGWINGQIIRSNGGIV